MTKPGNLGKTLWLLSLFCLVGCSALKPVEPEEAWDPIEPVNRGIYWFNDRFDRYLLEPVSEGYDWVLPDVIQSKISNALSNLLGPRRFVNALLQLKPDQASRQFGRFVINTTVGLGGLFDVAAEWGVPKHDEDLGVTLAYYGIPAGPYLVLPILGPSNLRDAIGRVGDGFMEPTYYVGMTNWAEGTQWCVVGGVRGIDALDTRVELDEAIETAHESALDEYLFLQSAYYQFRNGRLYDGEVPGADNLNGEEDLEDSSDEPSFDE